MTEYKLIKPIEMKKGGKVTTIDTIQLEDLKVKHFKIMPPGVFQGINSPPQEYIPLVAELTKVEEIYIEEMHVKDYMKLMKVVTEQVGEFEESQAEDGKN